MGKTIGRRSMTAALTLGGMVAVGSALCALPAKAVSWDGYVRDFVVFNETGSSIVGLRISDVGQGTYGPNLLRGWAVRDRGSVVVSPEGSRGYCLYDVLYELSDGTSLVRDRMNVCDEVGVVLWPNGWVSEG